MKSVAVLLNINNSIQNIPSNGRNVVFMYGITGTPGEFRSPVYR